MITFDQILPTVKTVLTASRAVVEKLEWLIINRDLNGKVRLIVPAAVELDTARQPQIRAIAERLAEQLAPHVYSADVAVLYEADRASAIRGASVCPLDGVPNVWVADRQASEANWADIAKETEGPRRVVFFSIKGGVGRSTALAAAAWDLAQAGHKVLVLDLDLESPGLSTALLPTDRQPKYGITDWLVEDLVGNGDSLMSDMVATSQLSHDGEIHVVPAHGADPGEYVSKLGRVWMPKVGADGVHENWSKRLHRLVGALEARLKPDIVLIDSRAGIDEVAASCVTDLGANLVLLFALDGSQTWSGYEILFRHWQRAGVAEQIRERLQVVAALVPETDRADYVQALRERAYDLFADTLYDEVPSGDMIGEQWNFDPADEFAPHFPWEVRWHRSFAALQSLHARLAQVDAHEVTALFGPLLEGVKRVFPVEKPND